ncbi:PDZ domain [Phytophthora cactorum]|nr:PDZ domain [Phytophthora cactorum]
MSYHTQSTVVGVEKDVLFGVRVRKSFGSRAFWGTVVGCYWVSGGLFYKVSFDDGDVDIFSADEVLQDAQAAKSHTKENPQEQDKETTASRATTTDTDSTVQQPPATSSAPTPTTQTQQPTAQPVPAPQPPVQQAPVPASVVMPPSFVAPHPAFAHARPLPQTLAQQWTNASQPLSNKEIIRQRLSQNAAARQASYVPGYPRGVYVPANAVPMRTMPPAHSGVYQAQQQYMQQVVNSAAMRVTSGYAAPVIQHTRPMNQPQISTSATQHMQVSVVDRPSNEPTRSQAATTNGAQEIDLTQNEPEQGKASSLPDRIQQTPNPAPTSDRGSTVNTPATSTGTSLLTTHDVETIAKLAERDPQAAQRFMKKAAIPTTSLLMPNEAPADTEMEDASHTMSFLSPSAPTDSPTEHETAAASRGMSFLSPNDFNVESSTPSRPENSAGSGANQPAEVKSNVSLVTVKVSRSRLYLTLGVQGTLIAVTSFVRDEFGRPGEVEQSGKVFLGDVLVRINHVFILPGMTPNHVADIVNNSSRPLTLWFERASWEILDGKA